MRHFKKLLSIILGVIFILANITACAEGDVSMRTENGKIIVDNAAENGRLIVAFYKDGVLEGVRIGKGDNKIEFDIESEMSGDLSDATDLKAFFWDLESIKPLCDLLSLPLSSAAEPTPSPEPKRALTVYFSCTNNTKSLAQKIAGVADTDLYEIVPEVPYTSADLNYNSDCRANREQNDPNARPAISGSIENLSDYDTIFLGYPIWWGTIPKIINTFLDSYDLSGKTIMPFCTSGSTGIGTSVSAIRSAYPDITVTEGFRGTSSTTAAQIEKWITDNGFKINTEEDDTMKMRVTSGDAEVVFALNNTSAAKSLYGQLPMTVDVGNYSNNEKIFYPEALDCTDVIEGDCPAGTLAYFSPWDNVVMYYGPASRYSGLYILGEAVEGADNISKLSGTIEITKAE